MHIPAIPNYNSIMHSGCSLKYANFIRPKRLYTHGLKFELEFMPWFMVFPFGGKTPYGFTGKYIGFNTFQCLKVEDNPDLQSLISLN